MRRWLWLGWVGAAAACGGTTGGSLITVPFAVAGAPNSVGHSLVFVTPLGWNVQLATATIALGPFYFNVTPPPTNAFRGGTFIMQVTQQQVLDALDPTWIKLSTAADGETGTAIAVEIGLLPPDDSATAANLQLLGTNVGWVAGSASRGAATIDFGGPITINAALATPQTPLAALARVNGATAQLNFTAESRMLRLQVDPSHWFDNADFANLPPAAGQGPRTWGVQSTFLQELLDGVQAQSGVYTFSLTP